MFGDEPFQHILRGFCVGQLNLFAGVSKDNII